MNRLTRRRFVTIAAAAAGALALPAGPAARPSARWSGVALGAPASIVIDGLEPAAAAAAVAAARAEIGRLEALFSLYRPDSAITRLNRGGHLDRPDGDFLALLSLARALWRASGGAFDPTVQPLWQALADGGSPAAARAAIGFEHVRFSPERVSFARAGMAITLNGIAQGYITDLVAELLRARGLGHVLVDIGEIAAIGGRDDATPWPVAIRRLRPAPHIVSRVTLADRALATSEPLAATLDRAGTLGHILDPGDLARAPRHALVTVKSGRAALADGLSTAFCLMDERAIAAALATFPDCSLVHIE
jgi:thiamine biosynthesis lipoprotein